MLQEDAKPRISVVVPVRDEAPSIEPLLAEMQSVLQASEGYEVIWVDDGSSDDTAAELARLADGRPWLRYIRHAAGYGKSAALRTGVQAAHAPIVVTINGDGRNDPAAIPHLVAELAEAGPGCGLVAGQRLGRRDPASRRLRSKIGNSVRAALLDDGTRDATCGLKCFPRSVFLELPQFDGMHRYLPALVRRDGYAISLVDVIDRPRYDGRTEGGFLGGVWRGVFDLIGVIWLVRRSGPVPVEAAEQPTTRPEREQVGIHSAAGRE